MEFLLEFYASRGDGVAVRRSAVQARRAADELRRQGTPVRWLRSIYVPDDETCLFLYEAVSADAVREAARRAALPLHHVREAVTSRKEDT